MEALEKCLQRSDVTFAGFCGPLGRTTRVLDSIEYGVVGVEFED
jgi:hypothetical protein